jgi:hypothetical protein
MKIQGKDWSSFEVWEGPEEVLGTHRCKGNRVIQKSGQEPVTAWSKEWRWAVPEEQDRLGPLGFWLLFGSGGDGWL